jgi:putative N-acetylmannosamine-6-phosphate epimerase
MDQGIIVSIQKFSKSTTQELAKKAIEGGAVAIRTDQAMKVKCDVIGLRKIPDRKYYITSELWAVKEVMQWTKLIAIDSRRGNTELEMLYAFCHINDISIVADIETIDDVTSLLKMLNERKINTPSYIATTFSNNNVFLIQQIKQITTIPIIAEGGYNRQLEIETAKKLGAYAVCIGEAISKIDCLTNKFVRHWNGL